jgi:hypothetical protein
MRKLLCGLSLLLGFSWVAEITEPEIIDPLRSPPLIILHTIPEFLYLYQVERIMILFLR